MEGAAEVIRKEGNLQRRFAVILFITGFHPVPFDRLISMGDLLAQQIDEEVVIQKGVSEYATRKARSFGWIEQNLFDKLVEEARILVCHAGVGSILDGKKRGKPVIVVPRRMNLGEHYDDHQMEIARAASKSGSVILANDVNELAIAIGTQDIGERLTEMTTTKSELVLALRVAVDELAEGL